MNYEFIIAKRYIWSKRRHPFVGVIATISVLGICVGVAALIVVLAVMNGFDEDLKNRIIGMRAHVIVEKDGAFGEAPEMIQKLKQFPGVAAAAPFIEGQALAQKDEWASGVLVRGIDAEGEKRVSKFHEYLKAGTMSGEEGVAVVGSEFAKRLGIGLGASFTLFAQNTEKPLAYRVEGIFSSGMYDYDANLIFLNIQNAQRLFNLGAVDGISIYLKDPEKAFSVKKALQKTLGYPYDVRTWMELNQTLFGALKLEKTVMFLILALIILVAALNIAGSLTILVMDKTKDIGVLKALGAAPFSLMKVFALDGLLIGFGGACAGLGIGAGLCFLLKRYSLFELPKEIYFIERLPVRMDWSDTLAIVGVALALSFLSACYPAMTAGRLDPVKALRYE